MISRCWFITSSYSSRCLRILKFRPSTFFCARCIERVTMGWVITCPSSIPMRSIIDAIRSELKRRIKSSSRDRKNRDAPGSPCRPLRPRSWRSIRRDSCRSVPMIYNPPSSFTPCPSLISVPRPAILVAIVIACFSPARATISASRWCCLAFNTL